MTTTQTSMSVLEAIRLRRSVRAFSPQRLDRTIIQQLLDAAVRAPTAVHEEPWAFAIVQDPGTLKRLSNRAKPLFLEEVHRAHLDRGGHALSIFSAPGFNIFYDAGTLIVICAKPTGPFVVADCWLAAENLMLAACALGLGTCVIGSALPGLNLPDVKAELGIPVEFTPVAPVIVGVPSEAGHPTPRRQPQVLAWR
jgi:nitroreductase